MCLLEREMGEGRVYDIVVFGLCLLCAGYVNVYSFLLG